MREAPGTGPVVAPAPLLDRAGLPLPAAKLATVALTGVAPKAACQSRRRIVINVRGLRRAVVTAGGKRVAVKSGRAVIDARSRPAGRLTVRTTGRTVKCSRVVRVPRFALCRPKPR